MTTDEDAIRMLVETWIAASKAGDLDTMLSLTTDDVVFLVPGAEPMRKADFAATARQQASQSAFTIDGTSEIEEIEVHVDIAFMRTRLEVVATPADGSAPVIRGGRTLTILRRENGRWRIARDANLLVAQAGPAGGRFTQRD